MKLDRKTIKRLKEKYGEHVLITGATSGIGKELARNFAVAGFKLIITGRRTQVLNDLCTEFYDDFNTDVIPITGDLSNPEDIQLLIRETAHLPIGIAIMNAGFGTSGKLIEADIDSEVNLIDLNIKSLLVLTHHFSKKMKGKGGAIVLLSSMVAFQGVPNAANYSASKAYVQSLGEALAIELKPFGVDVLTAAPGPVDSGFSARANMQMGKAMKPEQIAAPIIKAIGSKSTVLPGFLTKLLVYNLRTVPRWAKVRIMGMVMSGFTRHQSQ